MTVDRELLATEQAVERHPRPTVAPGILVEEGRRWCSEPVVRTAERQLDRVGRHLRPAWPIFVVFLAQRLLTVAFVYREAGPSTTALASETATRETGARCTKPFSRKRKTTVPHRAP